MFCIGLECFRPLLCRSPPQSLSPFPSNPLRICDMDISGTNKRTGPAQGSLIFSLIHGLIH